jgi:hypothetical protein
MVYFQNGLHLGLALNIVIEVIIWPSAVLDGWKKVPAESFHDKRPGCPEWASLLKIKQDVEEGVNRQRAGRGVGGSVLVVIPVHSLSV